MVWKNLPPAPPFWNLNQTQKRKLSGGGLMLGRPNLLSKIPVQNPFLDLCTEEKKHTQSTFKSCAWYRFPFFTARRKILLLPPKVQQISRIFSHCNHYTWWIKNRPRRKLMEWLTYELAKIGTCNDWWYDYVVIMDNDDKVLWMNYDW